MLNNISPVRLCGELHLHSRGSGCALEIVPVKLVFQLAMPNVTAPDAIG
ncbi:hypothetical protein QQ020_22070 [Fulvivirgaceae bacterium BMA12]|uniref:Uncharacterized protein n=1 Tax=Agaribacillus aureus TaxID=3051825 RepID=A0ABT8LAJ5_9BACT|nr:hypothetical protein [Fulvivirgaceae bacterium BMA12]